MAHLARRVSGGIGGQEGKGVFVPPVLHQVEENPLGHMEMLALLRQVHLHRPLIAPYLLPENLQQPAEDRGNPLPVHMLRPDGEGHRPQERLHILFQSLHLHLFPGQFQLRQPGQASQEGVGYQVQEASGGRRIFAPLLESHLVQGIVSVRLEPAPPCIPAALLLKGRGVRIEIFFRENELQPFPAGICLIHKNRPSVFFLSIYWFYVRP